MSNRSDASYRIALDDIECDTEGCSSEACVVYVFSIFGELRHSFLCEKHDSSRGKLFIFDEPDESIEKN